MNARVTTQSSSPTVRPLWLADLTLLLVAIIWGVNIPVMKVALRTIDAYAFNAIRLVVSSAVLIFFARREFLNGIRPASTLSKRNVCIYASVVSMAYQLLFLLAISRATSADVALIMATVPMWTAIGARFFLKEILPLLAWVGLIMAFSGTMIVTLHKAPTPTNGNTVESGGQVIAETTAVSVPVQQHESEASRRLLGNLFALSAALAWAAGTVFSRENLPNSIVGVLRHTGLTISHNHRTADRLGLRASQCRCDERCVACHLHPVLGNSLHRAGPGDVELRGETCRSGSGSHDPESDPGCSDGSGLGVARRNDQLGSGTWRRHDHQWTVYHAQKSPYGNQSQHLKCLFRLEKTAICFRSRRMGFF